MSTGLIYHGITVTVHNMVDPGSEMILEKRHVQTQRTMAYNTRITYDGNKIVIVRIIDSYLNQDEDAATLVNTVNTNSINWKEDQREKKQFIGRTEKQAETDGDFDIEQPELEITVKPNCLTYSVDDLNSICKTLGNADVVSASKYVLQKEVRGYFNNLILLNISCMKILSR